MKEKEIARMLRNVADDPLNIRLIVELNTTHKTWDNRDYNDYFMIDLSNGDGETLYEGFEISSDFGERKPYHSTLNTFSDALCFVIRDLVRKGFVKRIYNESY
jgi:hypothetical protein